MGRVADSAGIHYRMLNQSKGPAVRGPRAQMDRTLYQQNMAKALGQIENLVLEEDGVEDLILVDSNETNPPVIGGVTTTSGRELKAPKVVITTGTFLRGLIHIGKKTYPAGRHLRDSYVNW